MVKKIDLSANADIIEGFSKLARKYELEKDRGRALTYRKVVTTLKGIVEPITGSAQLKGMKGIGQKVLGKIDEYFANGGQFRKIVSAFDKSKMNVIDAFKGIHGVGDEKAKQLYEKGYRSIKGLREKRTGTDGKEVLTKIQSIGLDHYEDLQHKIPRKEVEKISKTVSKAV